MQWKSNSGDSLELLETLLGFLFLHNASFGAILRLLSPDL